MPARRLWLEPLCGCDADRAARSERRGDCSATARRRSASPMSRRPARATSSSCRSSATNRSKAGSRCSTPSSTRRRTRAGARARAGLPGLRRGQRARSRAKGNLPPAARSGPACTRRVPAGAPVVWWDPAVLDLDVEEQAPLRQQRILEADPDGAAAAASEQNYAAWKTEREALLARASEPSLSVQTVTSLARSAAARAAETCRRKRLGRGAAALTLRGWSAATSSGRAGGASARLCTRSWRRSISTPVPDAIQAAAAVHGRIVGATEEEISAAIATVGRVLEHPILRRAAAAPEKAGSVARRRSCSPSTMAALSKG